MISKLILTILVVMLWFISCLSNGYALPVYKNYNSTDMLITKFKLGSLFGKSDAEDFYHKLNEKGLTVLFETNPLYNIPYLNKIYLGVSADSFFNENFRTNTVLLNFSYFFPLISFSSSDWVPSVNLYINSSLGVRYIHGNTNEEYSFIGKYGEISSLAVGAEIYPKLLKDYKIAFYLEFRNIYSNYNIIINNINYCKSCRNSFVVIGFLYKTNYLIKCE